MTREERKLALYCLKANSDFHKEVCEECDMYPSCDHFIQDSVTEKLIEELEQQPCEEKIIEWKKDFKEYVNSLSMLNDDYKGIMEYIDELPVTPQEPCKDAISREDALDALHMCLSTNSYDDDVTGDSYICYEEAEYEIEKLPSVQPKPKTGHWIFDEILDKHYYCSECKSMGVDYWDYCPYCGARMVEPQESEEV